jgi:signal transduction histidine kinase
MESYVNWPDPQRRSLHKAGHSLQKHVALPPKNSYSLRWDVDCACSLCAIHSLGKEGNTMRSAANTANYPEPPRTSATHWSAPSIFNRNTLFNGYTVIFSLSVVLVLATAHECHSITYFPSLLYGVALWGWWGSVATGVWWLGRRFPTILSFSPKAIAIHVFVGSALGLLHMLLMQNLDYLRSFLAPHSNLRFAWPDRLYPNTVGMGLLIYGFIFGIAGVVQFQTRAQRDAMKALDLERQLSAAHLRALQMQLEPHFLFNTLNAITTLVELGRQKEAAEMLSHLNAMLKSTLKRTTPEKVPLGQELELVENYLAIEQVRFADRLRTEIKVEPAALEGLVPCFLLQPIVENAIRHGIAGCEAGGRVEASANRQGSTLHLRVRDTGSGLPPETPNGHGIGLSNTRDRLSHFYGENFSMKAESVASGGFEVAITIPYERNA